MSRDRRPAIGLWLMIISACACSERGATPVSTDPSGTTAPGKSPPAHLLAKPTPTVHPKPTPAQRELARDLMASRAAAYSKTVETFAWVNRVEKKESGSVGTFLRVGPGIAQLLATAVTGKRADPTPLRRMEESLLTLFSADFVAMRREDWPADSDELQVAALGRLFRFSGGALTLRALDKPSFRVMKRYKKIGPWSQRPTAVFAHKDLRHVFVEIEERSEKEATRRYRLELFDLDAENFRPAGPELYAGPLEKGRVLKRGEKPRPSKRPPSARDSKSSTTGSR